MDLAAVVVAAEGAVRAPRQREVVPAAAMDRTVVGVVDPAASGVDRVGISAITQEIRGASIPGARPPLPVPHWQREPWFAVF